SHLVPARWPRRSPAPHSGQLTSPMVLTRVPPSVAPTLRQRARLTVVRPLRTVDLSPGDRLRQGGYH
ncbi:MAG: hypothetical protein ACRDTC_19345, partial [Pseudonocardiaceae bacterium]